MFFQKGACPQSLSPLGHSDGFALCKAWCVLILASLPKTHFPVKGCVCFVGFASLQSLWAYTPGIRVGDECGAAALTKQGRLQSVAHSRCTMRRHKRLTTRIGATPQTPFLITIEFFQQKSNPPSMVNSVTADNLILKRIFLSYSVKIQCPAVYLICSVIKQIFYLCTAVSIVQVEIRHCCGKASIGNIGNDAGCSIPYILSV